MDRAASSAEHFAHGSRDARWTPPDQYGLVESQVYRSAFLTPASFDFINLLNLRTVVNLSQEVPVRAVLSFFQENHITLENVGLQVWTSMAFAPITQELIKEALQHVLDVSRHPLLLMSSSGTHQVGVLVGCLRRQQSWNLASILDEYRSFASPSARLNCEQFIELWDTVPLRSLKAGPARGAAPRQPRHPSLLARATSAPDCSAPSGERGREPQRWVSAAWCSGPCAAWCAAARAHVVDAAARTTQDQLSLPLRPPAWWAEEQQMLHADLAAWEALRDQAAGTASKTSPSLRRPASEGNQLSEARQYRRPDPRSGPGREYFRVSGPLASPGTTTSMVDEDED